MTALAWDASGERFFETGIDRGVLYLSDGSGVVWNGLTSFDDKSTGQTTPVYFDGLKYNDLYVQGDYEATLKAYTYPDEFMEFEGVQDVGNGFFVSGQTPRMFGLSYRTLVGNDLDQDLGYKIHLLANLVAVPSNRSYKTNAKTIGPIEFEWSISAIPSRVPGYKPSAHLIFDTRSSSPEFITYLEEILYGSESTDPRLPSFIDILNIADSWTPV